MDNQKNSIKLAHITTIPFTQVAFLKGQNKYMQRRGFEIHGISSPGRTLEQLAERDNIKVHSVPISRTIHPWKDIISLIHLFIVLIRLRPQIVNIGTPKAALLGSIAAWATRVPLRIFQYHGSITENAEGFRRKLFRFLESITAKLCHEVVCVSPSLLEFAKKKAIIPSNKGVVIAKGMCNGIDISNFSLDDKKALSRIPFLRQEFNLPKNAVIIGFVGRIAADKGIEELYEAFANLCREYDYLRLLIIGPVEQENAVSSDILSKLEVNPRTHFTGHTADVVPFYSVMDLLILPTHGTEGFPTVLMEAAAMNLPVVATKVVGCVDAVQDGVTGTLVPPRDSGALADAIRMYLEDPELRREHGQAGRERVLRDFRQEVIWEATYQEYVHLLGKKGLPIPKSA